MTLYEASFRVLNWNIPLWVFLVIFIVVALLCLGLFLFFLLKKSKRVHSEYGKVDSTEFKRLETFEDLRDDFEQEMVQVKKVMRHQR